MPLCVTCDKPAQLLIRDVGMLVIAPIDAKCDGDTVCIGCAIQLSDETAYRTFRRIATYLPEEWLTYWEDSAG